MPRVCTVCEHPDRDAIDAALASGESLRVVSDRYDLGRSSVGRHAQRHLSAALTALQSQAQADRRASLLDRIEALIERAEAMFAAASEEGKASQALAVLKELRALLELLGKASGELDTRPQVTVNLMASEEWLAMRAALFLALQPYPDARAAVSGRLLQLEAGDS